MKSPETHLQLGEEVENFLRFLSGAKEKIGKLDNANDDMKIEVSNLIDQYQSKFEPIQKSLIDGMIPSVAARKKLFTENKKLNTIIEVKVPLLRQKAPQETISFNYPIADDGSHYAEKVRSLYYDSIIAETEMKNKERDLKQSLEAKLSLHKKVRAAAKELKTIDFRKNSLDKLIHFLAYSKFKNYFNSFK